MRDNGHRSSGLVSKSFGAVARALDSIQDFSGDDRAEVVEFLKAGRTREAAVRGGASTAVTALGDRGFRWPEFDRWQAIFAASGTFPARWYRTAPSSVIPDVGGECGLPATENGAPSRVA